MYIYIYLHKTSWVARAHCCYLITICFGVCSPQTTKFSVQAAQVSLLGCGHPAEASSMAPHEGHKLPRSRCVWQDPLKMAIEIVDFPIKNGGSFHSYVKLPEGKQKTWCFDHPLEILMKRYETVPSQLLATSKATIRLIKSHAEFCCGPNRSH